MSMYTKERVCIVGSGPSGVVAAHNLLENGFKVTLLDVGLSLDQDGGNLRQSYLTTDQKTLVPKIHSLRMKSVVAGQRGVPTKMPFASDFVYRTIPGAELTKKNAIPTASYAVGGLSQAWGANVSLLSDVDTKDWPVEVKQFETSFKKLRKIIDVSGDADEIDKNFPFSLFGEKNFPLGIQGQRVLDSIHRNQDAITASGLFAGRSKLAIGEKYSLDKSGCVSCGLCMHGCPYHAIFNAEDVLAELKRHKDFHYVPGAVVDSFVETSGGVDVSWHWLDSNEHSKSTFARLLIGAGVFNSTALVARSLKIANSKFRIKDSQKYLFLFLSKQRSAGALTKPANSLAQIYLQSKSLKTTKNMVHGQLYGYNDLILDPLRPLLGSFANFVPYLMPWFLERVMIGMIYLHSNDSGYLDFEVNMDDRSKLGSVVGERNPYGDKVASEFIDSINTNSKYFGGIAPKFLVQKNMVGGGLHYGSSLPMSLTSSTHTTDTQGRPYQCKRTHVIDSSVLPSIPGTPTTYSVMANSIRITDEIINNLKKGEDVWT